MWVHMCHSLRVLKESVLYFQHVVFENWTQVSGLEANTFTCWILSRTPPTLSPDPELGGGAAVCRGDQRKTCRTHFSPYLMCIGLPGLAANAPTIAFALSDVGPLLSLSPLVIYLVLWFKSLIYSSGYVCNSILQSYVCNSITRMTLHLKFKTLSYSCLPLSLF